MMPDGRPPSEAEDVRKARWRSRDVRRAIGAAEKAGLGGYRVEIAPDGTISIVVDARSKPSSDTEASGDPPQP